MTIYLLFYAATLAVMVLAGYYLKDLSFSFSAHRALRWFLTITMIVSTVVGYFVFKELSENTCPWFLFWLNTMVSPIAGALVRNNQYPNLTDRRRLAVRCAKHALKTKGIDPTTVDIHGMFRDWNDESLGEHYALCKATWPDEKSIVSFLASEPFFVEPEDARKYLKRWEKRSFPSSSKTSSTRSSSTDNAL